MAVAHPPLAVPAATTLPLLSLFCQCDFSGAALGIAVTTTPPLSRDVSALLGLEPPLLVLPAARKCGRREMETEGAGAVSTESGLEGGRGKVRRLRRKCQRKWVLCWDGSVGWLRKRSPSTPERGTVYVSLHT